MYFYQGKFDLISKREKQQNIKNTHTILNYDY